jgi:hypothetical protein
MFLTCQTNHIVIDYFLSVRFYHSFIFLIRQIAVKYFISPYTIDNLIKGKFINAWSFSLSELYNKFLTYAAMLS